MPEKFPLHALPLRVLPGEDLKLRLERLVREEDIPAGCIVSCAGSLSAARLRLAGGRETTVLKGPLEIVSLSGTLSRDGLHLHAAVADAEGGVSGGHLMEGCPVATTAEVVVGVLSGAVFARTHDSATGYAELDVSREERNDPFIDLP